MKTGHPVLRSLEVLATAFGDLFFQDFPTHLDDLTYDRRDEDEQQIPNLIWHDHLLSMLIL